MAVPLSVELSGALTRGRTIADFRVLDPSDCNTSVATRLDVESFWDLVIDAVQRLG